ncbi:MAG: alpha/beta hydrolase [Pedobacter sp.]|nr:alpha/beta hydrolase [Chitinophagaceae bacterium]
MKWWIKTLLTIIICLSIVYLVGPHPSSPIYSANLPKVPTSMSGLENYIVNKEAQHRLRPNNEARIVWADSLQQPTDYAIVYLHGFSASQEEGNPAHRTIANKFGCNLYLSRLAEHGIDTTDQLLNLTADNYWESGKEALAIGKELGKKVILMGTSTGGTLALKLAATYPDDVFGLILYSPNIAINDSKAFLLNNPWGLQIARKVKHSYYNTPTDTREIYKQYWNTPYRLEAAVALEELLETTMTEATFKAVHQPTLVLYYYKDEQHQDSVVKVSATQDMMKQLGTPTEQKREVAMPKTEDHVIGSPIKSKDVEGVISETEKFMVEVLKMKVIN